MTIALVIGFAPVSNAASLNTSGTWTNVLATDSGSITGAGTNQLSWGTPASGSGSGQSGYRFTGVTDNIEVSDLVGSDFLVGTFTHFNFPITGTSLDEATLNINFALGSASSTFSFLFDHFETPNNANPCAAGGEGSCPDLVSFPNATSQEIITLYGVNYNLTLSGFSEDGGENIVDSFLTLEAIENSAGLYATLTAIEDPNPVPEPASTMALLTLGILGFGCTLKNKIR
ncbi:MAG: PEP-CTERM sorting domain-containing protein [Roseofilum sp. SBFL]|uniref:THxN family PEP-CTERM protein n=1 Tax=unclassified Roseofilum TaxID=2620099 RepID=UPI001B192FD7|nr:MULTISPECIES: THxN family PEP-CTERM protein [unclassified Roseofilum]MBP0015369.1 PEP-CTERM sorting domain-containing protein [Roseofilum sp. SID3]MBP0040677.1 PEP-CTERM sorting domain-containing protein [Roseofilum sp. SBFL]